MEREEGRGGGEEERVDADEGVEDEEGRREEKEVHTYGIQVNV